MKRFLTGFCLAVCASAACGQAPEDGPLVKPEAIYEVIREAAAKVEAKYKSTREEADGLAQAVEEILASPTPPQNDEGDLNQRRATAMSLLSMGVSAHATLASVRGYVFDDSPAGHQQRYEALEQAAGGNEVRRLLEMRHAANKLGWKDKEELCHQRALGAVRAWIVREPDNAEAHALLAETLKDEAGPEAWAAARTALKLNSKQCWAQHCLLDRRIVKALESAVLRRESGLDETMPGNVRQLLFSQPLTEAETLAFGKQQEELRRDAEALLKLALEREDLAAYLATIGDLMGLRSNEGLVALASRRTPDMSFEAFQRQAGEMAGRLVFSLLTNEEHLRGALRLADNDPEALGTLMLLALLGDAATMMGQGKQPSVEKVQLAEETLRHLVEIAQADDSPKAARAAEAACLMQFVHLMMGRRPPHAEMVLRTVRLDPFRHRTVGMLMGLCAKQKDKPASYALARLQLAVVPDFATRQICAATAVTMQDWSHAQLLLDACAKEKPDDIILMNQRIATLLRQSQSKATQKKAATLFDKIEALGPEVINKLPQGDLASLAINHVMLLAISGKNEQAKAELTKVVNEGVVTEDSAKELRPLLD